MGAAHSHARRGCDRSVALLRDPVNRMGSAYHYCKMWPWDRVLARVGWAHPHCCSSSVLENATLSSWLLAVLNDEIDCRMPRAGYPSNYIAPTSYWTSGSNRVTFLRTQCLELDARRVLNVRLISTSKKGLYNSSPNRDCGSNLTDQAWQALISSQHDVDFLLVYGRRFPSQNEWRRACRESVLRECNTVNVPFVVNGSNLHLRRGA